MKRRKHETTRDLLHQLTALARSNRARGMHDAHHALISAEGCLQICKRGERAIRPDRTNGVRFAALHAGRLNGGLVKRIAGTRGVGTFLISLCRVLEPHAVCSYAGVLDRDKSRKASHDNNGERG